MIEPPKENIASWAGFDELVRDFTSQGFMAKSEARRRFGEIIATARKEAEYRAGEKDKELIEEAHKDGYEAGLGDRDDAIAEGMKLGMEKGRTQAIADCIEIVEKIETASMLEKALKNLVIKNLTALSQMDTK